MTSRQFHFARESYADCVKEVMELLPEHWREMALWQDQIPLMPDYGFYEAGFKLDLMRIYTARDDRRNLIGYAIFMITKRHPHYDHKWVKDDTIWLMPEFRQQRVATGLFDCFEADFAKEGPVVIQIETRFGHPELDLMVKRRGYGETGHIYGKRFA